MNVLRLLLLPVLSLTLTSCIASADVSLSAVSFLATKALVSDDAGNEVAAVGYLKAALVADLNLEGLAAEHGAELWYSAETCETHVQLSVWPYLLVNGTNLYTALVAYKDVKGGSYNLASRPEDICMTVGIGSMNPFVNARSKVIRYVLPSSLTEELRAYESGGGVVDFKLSPDCQSRLCRPTLNVNRTKLTD